MNFIEWNSNYSVGVDIIDSQHKMLVDIVNEISEALRQNKTKDEVSYICEKLLNFVTIHFKTEEDIMIEKDYEDYTIHRYEHEKLIDEMKRLIEDYKQGNVFISQNLIHYFRQWLIEHIMAKDKKLSGFLKNNC